MLANKLEKIKNHTYNASQKKQAIVSAFEIAVQQPDGHHTISGGQILYSGPLTTSAEQSVSFCYHLKSQL